MNEAIDSDVPDATSEPASVVRFYDQLAGSYDRLFPNWHEAVRWYGQALDGIIRRHHGPPPLDVLDCTAGIGTQALGLAGRGYRVHATDLSPASITRAREEAAALGIALTCSVADLRTLADQVDGQFDVVLSCGNSLPHLLTDEELLRALHHMGAKLKPDGLLLINIRDYDQHVRERTRATTPRVTDTPDGTDIAFQVWDWPPDARLCTVHLFLLRGTHDGWNTTHQQTTYRTLQRDELTALLSQAGFAAIRWEMPDKSGYDAPIVTARKAAQV
jgi:glycine/sarcosine N-methyltransferase